MTQPFGRMTAYALVLLLLACSSAAAQDDAPTPQAASPDIERSRSGPEESERRVDGMVTERLSSEPKEAPGRGVKAPVGPALDGVRGSALGPAPGAFGTDAGSPSDLRR